VTVTDGPPPEKGEFLTKTEGFFSTFCFPQQTTNQDTGLNNNKTKWRGRSNNLKAPTIGSGCKKEAILPLASFSPSSARHLRCKVLRSADADVPRARCTVTEGELTYLPFFNTVFALVEAQYVPYPPPRRRDAPHSSTKEPVFPDG